MTPARRRDAKLQKGAKAADSVAANDDSRFAALCKSLAKNSGCAQAVAEYSATRARGGARRFGSNALRVKGKIFAMMAQDTLVLKLPAPRVEALVAAGKGARFDPGHGRIMREWIALSAESSQWPMLALEAFDFVNGQGR